MNEHKTYEQGWREGYDKAMKDAREALKPVKKTEKTRLFELRLLEENTVVTDDKLLFGGELTPTTADKLSEACSALVECVTEKELSPTDSSNPKIGLMGNLMRKAQEAAESYQEANK